MRIQLWSYNYDPEPSGIAPLSAAWARAMTRRGPQVQVVAAHPHYPEPLWGTRLSAYRERRDGVDVLRLPLWIGRETAAQRFRQEFSFAASLGTASVVLPRADVIVAVSPSFPALAPVMAIGRIRRTPWLLWLQDILPDAAATTGMLDDGLLLRALRRFERAAYRSAREVVVISEAFKRNLAAKGVPETKTRRIYNPSPVETGVFREGAVDARRALIMGNIGHSQGLAEVVRTVEDSGVLEHVGGVLRIAGQGVRADEVRAAVRTERVKMVGLLHGEEMEAELAETSLGVVTQRPDVTEFNLPSKLMNYMAHGLPVLAVVGPGSETARLVNESGAGVVVDAARLEDLPAALSALLTAPDQLRRMGLAAHRYAEAHFTPSRVAERWEAALEAALRPRPPGSTPRDA